MKNLILILIIVLIGCVQPPIDVLTVTNTELKPHRAILNYHKDLIILQPGESVDFYVSGYNHIEIGLFSDEILVDGQTNFP
jgi:hypothetical protein